MRSKAVCAFRVSSSFYASLDHARLRTPFTLEKHNTWITIMEQGNNDFLPCCFYQNQRSTYTRGKKEKEREQETHTHSASCNTLSLPCLASFQIISICERISPERHASKSFLCLRFIPARSKEIIPNLLAWLDREREKEGGICCTATRNICKKIIPHLFPISLLCYSHRTEAQAVSGLPSIHFFPYGHDRESLVLFFALWSDRRLRIGRADPRSA